MYGVREKSNLRREKRKKFWIVTGMCHVRRGAIGEMERAEKRKRGKETWDHEKKEMKKRQVMTTTTTDNDDNDVGISYKLENMTNSNDPGGQENIMKITYDDNEKGKIGVFDFPWLKKRRRC
uniref:Uncharacterized protein n=1 Tax=Nicotiana tabacum TaxID=4097 RepID=A0A1S3YLQ4_TOBAC|nr:PREDICTED: uncharacterized protein LOC107777434 [Nicotiana tabacum]